MNDFSDLNRLAVDLSGADSRARRRIPAVLDRAGEAIRDDARAFAPGARGGRARHYPKAITHELVARGLAVEVGPEKGGQGSLGHIFEYGTSRAQPQAHLGPALDRHVPDTVDALADVLADTVFE